MNVLIRFMAGGKRKASKVRPTPHRITHAPVRLAASVLDQTIFGPNTIARLLYVILVQLESRLDAFFCRLLVHLRLLRHLAKEEDNMSQQREIALRESAQHRAHELLLLINGLACGTWMRLQRKEDRA